MKFLNIIIILTFWNYNIAMALEEPEYTVIQSCIMAKLHMIID